MHWNKWEDGSRSPQSPVARADADVLCALDSGADRLAIHPRVAATPGRDFGFGRRLKGSPAEEVAPPLAAPAMTFEDERLAYEADGGTAGVASGHPLRIHLRILEDPALVDDLATGADQSADWLAAARYRLRPRTEPVPVMWAQCAA